MDLDITLKFISRTKFYSLNIPTIVLVRLIQKLLCKLMFFSPHCTYMFAHTYDSKCIDLKSPSLEPITNVLAVALDSIDIIALSVTFPFQATPKMSEDVSSRYRRNSGIFRQYNCYNRIIEIE